MNIRFNTLSLVGLLLLCLVPALAGIARLAELLAGSTISAGNARFFASPLPVVLHIVASLAYSIGGAFQYLSIAPGGKPDWHKSAGRVLATCGMSASLSGLWMTQFYPPAVLSFDGQALYVMRLVVGFAMSLAILRGVRSAWRRDFPDHRRWMIRAYALGLGAGTQVLTHIPWFVFPEMRSEMLRTLCMGAGWAINVVVAEWLIARHSGAPRRENTATGQLLP